MITDKKTVFILGAGASCPYGYPSGARLREWICFNGAFESDYLNYLRDNVSVQAVKTDRRQAVFNFIKTFEKSSSKSIDLFMANNPTLAKIGKYIIAYAMFRAEHKSRFRENANRLREIHAARRLSDNLTSDALLLNGTFHGGDWYFYIYNRFLEGLAGGNILPHFSNGNLAFITFNYDRSLEHFLYESLRNSFTEVSEDEIVESLKKLKILHVYGQIAPLKWQNPDGHIDYSSNSPFNESSLCSAASNIRTIYEEQQNPELIEAQNLLKQAEQIYFLGFSYAPENMKVLGLPEIIPSPVCSVTGSAFGLEDREIQVINDRIVQGLKTHEFYGRNAGRVRIAKMDCLDLLRNYF